MGGMVLFLSLGIVLKDEIYSVLNNSSSISKNLSKLFYLSTPSTQQIALLLLL